MAYNYPNNRYMNDGMMKQLKTKQDCLQEIVDISVDYDGYRTAEKLMELIDEMQAYACWGLKLEQQSVIC